MEKNFFDSAHAKFENLRYLKMRGRNQNYEWKFGTFIKFCVEWYIVIVGIICLCQKPNQIQDCVGAEPLFRWKVLHMPNDAFRPFIDIYLLARSLMAISNLNSKFWFRPRIQKYWWFDSHFFKIESYLHKCVQASVLLCAQVDFFEYFH